MKDLLTWSVLLGASLVLQCTLLPLLTYNGTHADILLVVVVLASLHLGRKQGAMIGFSAGLLQDLYSGTFIGMNMFSKLLIGYFFGMAERQVFKENIFLPVVAAGAATIVNYCIGACIIALLGYRFNLMENMMAMLVPLLLYNIVLALPIHKLICFLHEKTKA